jgi:transposase-like protein
MQTPEAKNSDTTPIGQGEFQRLIWEKMSLAVRLMLISVLEDEAEEWVGARRYERSATRKDQRIGTRTRDLGTSVGQIKDLPVPRTRGGFQTQLFEKYQRRQGELDQMIGDMFVQGVSQVRVGTILETLNGVKPSASTVSRVFHTLEEEYEQWKQRELPERYAYVFADGTYFSVIYGDEGQKTPVLALFGIRPDGKREVIAITIGQSESKDAWGNVLDDIKSRGVKQVDLWVTDGNQTMIDAIRQRYPDSQRQRCVKHKLGNVLAHVPEKHQDVVGKEFMAIFYQKNREKADQQAAAFRQKYRAVYAEAIACMDRDWEACLTFYGFPEAHWVRIRTTNVIERLFLEVKKRSKKMAAAFRNETSCMLLFYAVVRSLTFQNVRMDRR